MLYGSHKGWSRHYAMLWCTLALMSESDLERDKGFEPSPSAWKADMLAVKHQSRRVRRLLKESLEL